MENKRDTQFLTMGIEYLSRSLWPELLSVGRLTEMALWLKVFVQDSGVARTPEETIARAYDVMPGIKRPDFVPA